MFVQPCYCYDNQSLFVGMSYNIIIPKMETNLLFILGVINSKYAQNWFYCNAKHRGAGVDVGVEKLRSFPIPNPSKCQQEEIIMLVDNIIRNKKLNVDTIALENRIDSIVYQLYGLTDAEIKMIEESV